MQHLEVSRSVRHIYIYIYIYIYKCVIRRLKVKDLSAPLYLPESDAIYSGKNVPFFRVRTSPKALLDFYTLNTERENFFFRNVGKFLPHDAASHPEEQFC